MELTNSKYWAKCYSNYNFRKHEKDHAVYQYIDKFIPDTDDKSFLEIGSFPGSFSAKFGDKGYVLNGIDIYAENALGLVNWFKSLKYKIGEFFVSDFFNHEFNKKYNVVGSFGFIEHFTNFTEVIKNHLDLVEVGGYIIIVTPNYRGFFQKYIHRYFAKNDFNNHFIPSMNPECWEKVIATYGFKTIHCGYFGGFKLWVPLEKKSFINKLFFRIVYKLSNILNSIIWFESSLFSQYCGIVAQKK